MKKKSKYLILEFTEFNSLRLNSDGAIPGIAADDKPLSQNAFDKHEDILRQGIAKLSGLNQTLMGSTSFRSLKSKMALDDQDVKQLKVLKITKNNFNYDVYLSFVISDVEYWGVIRDILNNPTFSSEVFKDSELLQTQEWVIRLKGFMIKSVLNFLKPQFGKFKLINNEVICYSLETGKLLKMEAGQEIEVLKSYNNQIIFEYRGDKYLLTNDNFIYFNWWFEPIEKTS
jgi:hypothetical protein